MEFKAFVGIDVSKSTIDVWLKNVGKHNVFPNSMDGFKAMVEWIMDCLGPIAHEGERCNLNDQQNTIAEYSLGSGGLKIPLNKKV